MIASNDINDRIEEIKNYVANANLQEAVKRLMDFSREFYLESEDEVISLSARFNKYKVEERRGILSQADAGLEYRKISLQILKSLADITEKLSSKIINEQSVIGNKVQLEAILAERISALKVPEKLILKAANIIKVYKNTDFKLEIKDLELHLGTITGLVGENATGKTTLLRILAGDLKYDDGKLQFPDFEENNTLNWPDLKRQIAYIPQELKTWYGALEDNLRFEATCHGIKGKANKKALKYIIQRLGLSEHLDKDWAQLSGGYKLRFSLAKALIWQPRLLIIDEPLANLDVKAQLIVLNDLRNMSKSLKYPLSIILSSQHLHEVEKVSDQMLFMREGQLSILGKTQNYEENRNKNVFEIDCKMKYSAFIEVMKDLPHLKTWYNGMYFIISCPLKVSSDQLLTYFKEKNIAILYFRDISQSVKTKFYEAHL